MRDKREMEHDFSLDELNNKQHQNKASQMAQMYSYY